MSEISNFSDVSETVKKEPEGFKEIKSDSGMTVNEARSFWDNEFKPNDNFYTSYEERIDCTPVNGENGHWEGERGESKFIPSDLTEKGRAGIEKLAEYGLDGIEYKNGEPDYSKCCEATVKISDMTEKRYKNFDQADAKLAEQFNNECKDGRTDWSKEDIEKYRIENKLSWHECCDTKTMNLVSRDIHGGDTSVFKHSGGVAECKARDSKMNGGGFDE